MIAYAASSARALATAPLAPVVTEAVTVSTLRSEHAAEVRAGRAQWRCDEEPSACARRDWADGDFVEWEVVEADMAGPDEASLSRGHVVSATREAVVTEAECAALVAEAQRYVAGLPAGDARQVIGEAPVSALPLASEWLRRAAANRFFPILASRFGVDAGDLALSEALLLRYEGPSSSQPIHRDASLLSLNVALTTGFEGGGTYFEGLRVSSVQAPGLGCAVVHNSGVQHAGHSVSKGTRWVLVLFVLAESVPQVPRRAKAHGVRLRAEGRLDEAEQALDVGLADAPRDHQLHLTLASIHRLRGDAAAARRALGTAGRHYTYCTKALDELGKLLLEDRRPRAALRAYETALRHIGDRDVDGAWLPLRADAWNAKVQAARCAVLCCDAYGAPPAWRRAHLPAAIDRLDSATAAAPGDPRLGPLRAYAADLLHEATDVARSST